MEKEAETYSLEDLKNKIPKEAYNDMIKELTHKVLDFYESKSPLEDVDLNTTIAEMEAKHPNIDQETKQAVINRMKNMRFTLQHLYQSGSLQINLVDSEISYNMFVDVQKEQRRKILGAQLNKSIEDVNNMLKEIDGDGLDK